MYNPNFTPWKTFTPGMGGVQSIQNFQGMGRSPDQDLLTETYNADQSLQAINKAARLKHLRDVNFALARMGQGVGSDGTAAVNMAENYGGMPVLQGGPAVPLPPPGFGQPGGYSMPGQPMVPNPNNPRSQYLNSLLSQVSQDERQSMANSLFTPLEPYYSPFEKQLMLAQARGGSERPPARTYVNGVGNANAQAQAGIPRGTMPTANASLTDNRVRANNDTRQAEQMINNGSITSQKQLQDLFPDADWDRLGGLLTANQKYLNQQYDTQQASADLANQGLDQESQKITDPMAQSAYQKAIDAIPWYWNKSNDLKKQDSGGNAAIQAAKDEYNASMLDATAGDIPEEVIQSVMKPYGKQVQYDQASRSFVPIAQSPPDISENPPGYISRQDMPGQNFHTDLKRSPFYNGLPIVYSQADLQTLPAGADYVTGNGTRGRVPGGPMYGPRYAMRPSVMPQPIQYGPPEAPAPVQYGPPEPVNFGQLADRPVGNQVGFFEPTNRPVEKNLVNFGQGSIPAPIRGADGVPVLESPIQRQWLKRGDKYWMNGRKYQMQ